MSDCQSKQLQQDQKKYQPLDNFLLPPNGLIYKPNSKFYKSSKIRKDAYKFNPLIITFNGFKNLYAKPNIKSPQPTNVQQNLSYAFLSTKQSLQAIPNVRLGISHPTHLIKNYKKSPCKKNQQWPIVVGALDNDNSSLKKRPKINNKPQELRIDQNIILQNNKLQENKEIIHETILDKPKQNSGKEIVINMPQADAGVKQEKSEAKNKESKIIQIKKPQKQKLLAKQIEKEQISSQKQGFEDQQIKFAPIPWKIQSSLHHSSSMDDGMFPKPKFKETQQKEKISSKKRHGQKVPKIIQYMCHCNTRGCKDHYCGCYRQGLKCDISCQCSDCKNSLHSIVQKKVFKKQRMEMIGEVEMDLDFGIEFEPVCFNGFGNDEQNVKAGSTDGVRNGLQMIEPEEQLVEVQMSERVFLGDRKQSI